MILLLGTTTPEPVLQLQERYYVNIALSAGVVGGDRHCPLLRRAVAFVFITIQRYRFLLFLRYIVRAQSSSAGPGKDDPTGFGYCSSL